MCQQRADQALGGQAHTFPTMGIPQKTQQVHQGQQTQQQDQQQPPPRFQPLPQQGQARIFKPGDDFAADMKKMAADPEVQRWWAECKPCFERIEDLPPGEVWATMETVFFQA